MNQGQKPIVNCPACGAETIWDKHQNPHRPFCSAQCKNQDFVAWANEEHVIEGNSSYDDLLSEDLEERH